MYEPPNTMLVANHAQQLFENYFLIALVVALAVMVILYTKNPPLIQEAATEAWIEGKPNKKKIFLAGVTSFIFASFGPFLSEMIFESRSLINLLS